jgi:hypothetical protein
VISIAIVCIIAAAWGPSTRLASRYFERKQFCDELLANVEMRLTLSRNILNLERKPGHYSFGHNDGTILITIGEHELRRLDEIQAGAARDVRRWQKRISELRYLRQRFWRPIPAHLKVRVWRDPGGNRAIEWPVSPD